MFKSDPNSWDTNLLFTNALSWSKQKTRPNMHQLPQTIYFSNDFSKKLKDLEWMVEKDGASHMQALYGCGDDYFYGQVFSGVRGPLFSYYPTVTYASEADPYSWKQFIKVVKLNEYEIFRKPLERSRFADYQQLYSLTRIVAAPPSIDPTTKKTVNSFFTLAEISHCCFQTTRFINVLVTDYVNIVISTQETVLVKEVLEDRTLPFLKRLNTLHIASYRGKLADGKISLITV